MEQNKGLSELSDIVNGFIGNEPTGDFDIKDFLQVQDLTKKDLDSYKARANKANFPSHKYNLNSGSVPSIITKNLIDRLSNSDRKYRKAENFIMDQNGERKGTEDSIQGALNTIQTYFQQYKEAYKKAEEELKAVDDSLDKIDKDYKNLNDSYQEELDEAQDKIEDNERWSKPWIEGYFGKGLAKFKLTFTDMNYNIERARHKAKKAPQIGKKRTINKKFDKIAKEYGDLREAQINMEQNKEQAEAYLLDKKGPFNSGGSKASQYIEDFKDFMGL